MQRQSIDKIKQFLIRFTDGMNQQISKINQNMDRMTKSLEANEKTLKEIKENTLINKKDINIDIKHNDDDMNLDFITQIWDQSNTFVSEPQLINQTWLSQLLVSLGTRYPEVLLKRNIIGQERVEDIVPGDCRFYESKSGQITFLLLDTMIPKYFQYIHVLKTKIPKYLWSSSPRFIDIAGMLLEQTAPTIGFDINSSSDDRYVFGEWIKYNNEPIVVDINQSQIVHKFLQTPYVETRNGRKKLNMWHPIDVMRIKWHNWGAHYSCLYRMHVYGDFFHPSSHDSSSNKKQNKHGNQQHDTNKRNKYYQSERTSAALIDTDALSNPIRLDNGWR